MKRNIAIFFHSDLSERLKRDFCNTCLLRQDRIIPFPVVFSWLSFLKYTKRESKKILREMERRGLISIVPYHGIKFLGE